MMITIKCGDITDRIVHDGRFLDQVVEHINSNRDRWQRVVYRDIIIDWGKAVDVFILDWTGWDEDPLFLARE